MELPARMRAEARKLIDQAILIHEDYAHLDCADAVRALNDAALAIEAILMMVQKRG